MRTIRAASAALLGVAALALSAPAATAAHHGNVTPFGFTVSPSTVAPGGTVTLALSDCGRPATVSSGVFDTVTVPTGRSATATVDADARPGARYRVTFTCGGQSGTTELAIAAATSPVPTGSVASVPAGVQGGLGGSIGGLNTAEIVAGTALVVTAATGTVFVARRRAVGRRH
jgi:plastocyanin